MRKLFFFITMCAMVTQIFLPCYYGNEVLVTSKGLSTNLYKSNWPDVPLKHSMIIIVFMERLKQSTVVTVAKLFPLSLETFSSVG